MKLIWSLYRFLKGILPSSAIKKFRYLIETNFDFLWSREHYGQFGEDAIIEAILVSRLSRKEPGEIGSPDLSLRSRKGFYVDVGAYAPKQYSNTYAFYKKGWRGINIDATPGSMKAFRKVRKRDINIEAVISSRVGNVTLYSWGNPTVFNTISSEHAKKWELIVGKEPEKIPLRTITLEEILEIHIPPGQCIDFLSVDAESHDLEVLKSNNWTNHRPDVIAVEIDEEDIGKVLTDDIVTFMKSQRYRLRAWSGPTVFFEREGS